VQVLVQGKPVNVQRTDATAIELPAKRRQAYDIRPLA
jgi:hypothetical protein